MSLRQTRRALSPGAEGTLDCNSDERDSNNEYESHKAKRANKKSRTKPDVSKQDVEQKRVKGVRGKLKMLTEMPLDILFEVGSEFSRHSSANIFHRYLVTFFPGTCYVWLEPQSLSAIFLCVVHRFPSGKVLSLTLLGCQSVHKT